MVAALAVCAAVIVVRVVWVMGVSLVGLRRIDASRPACGAPAPESRE